MKEVFTDVTNSNFGLPRSVTNDEDEWVGSKKNSSGIAGTTMQHPPCDYKPSSSTSSVGINHYQQHNVSFRENNQVTTTENRKLSPTSPTNNFDEESYLIRYERMMKEQDTEQSITRSHVQSLLELLEDLLFEGEDKVKETAVGKNDDSKMLKEISFVELGRARELIRCSNEIDIIKTDKQFMMILQILSEGKEYFTIADDKQNCGDSRITNREHPSSKTTISWAEILQLYRCVRDAFPRLV